MNDRDSMTHLRQTEFDLLKKEYEKSPELFEWKTFIEDAETLGQFGIYIPGKESFPAGYLKLWPHDFIVEEVDSEKKLHDISLQKNVTPRDIPASKIFHATAVKCGISTIELIEDISRKLDCDKKKIAYAGIKDKDAITAQRISFNGIPLESILKLGSDYYFIKDIVPAQRPIAPGELLGNRFSLVVRTLDADLSLQDLKATTDSLTKRGYHNFYYLQRFGTPRLNNFFIASLILKGQYQIAVEEYLFAVTGREIDFLAELRTKAKTAANDWVKVKDVFSVMPATLINELKIVDHLIQNPQDYQGALATVPEQVQLWVYGLSSLLFNQKISDFLYLDKTPPQKLPLFLSRNGTDIDTYKEMLLNIGLYPPRFENLRRFPGITFQQRLVPTHNEIKFGEIAIAAKNIQISFFLDKGAYATTALSHVFNLISGKPPENLDDSTFLPQENHMGTLGYFKKIIRSKKENRFEE